MKMLEVYRPVFDSLPEDVKAVLALFRYTFCTDSPGRYFDLINEAGDEYVFYQRMPYDKDGAIRNRRRFIGWVRAGMPDGFDEGENNIWTVEDDDETP